MEKVRERLIRSTAALETKEIPSAVIGHHPIAAGASRVDAAAVRNTRNKDILIRRLDIDRVRFALEGAGFFYRQSALLDLFLESPQSSPRDARHLYLCR